MDPIKIQKLEAMNKYKKNQFPQNLFHFSVTALLLGLFFSSPFWFTSLHSSLKLFLISLPNIGAFFTSTKCLFLVGNIIVIFLVGESRLMGSFSSPTPDVYDEYVKQVRSLRKQSSIEKKEERAMEKYVIEETVEKIKGGGEEDKGDKEDEKEDEKEEEKEEENEEGGKEETKKGGEDLNGEEEYAWPADELKKRVEDFIARVNKQRRLEAKLLVYSG